MMLHFIAIIVLCGCVYNTWFDVHNLNFQECLNFLKEIHFGGSQDFSTKPFHHSGAILNLYMETSSAFLKVLL